MKLLTLARISTFLLLILFNTFQLKSDEQFKACLDKEQTRPAGANFTGMYDTINAFGRKYPDKTNFCCDTLQKCELMPSPILCDNLVSPRIFTQCVTINNAKFCISFGSSSLPGGVCGGILGEANPIDATIGTCPKNSDAIKNILIGQTDKFKWLCCNNENCKVPVSVEMSDPINITPTLEAITSCANNEYGLMCIKDNVWVCTGNISSTIHIWPNPIGSCLEQVSLSSTIFTSIETPSTSTTPPLQTDPPLPTSSTPKIVIGVLLSGVFIAIVVFLVYKYQQRKERRKRNEEPLDDNS